MFRVYGLIDGNKFDETFNCVAEWRVERALCERAGVEIVVYGMQSLDAYNIVYAKMLVLLGKTRPVNTLLAMLTIRCGPPIRP